MSITGRQLRIIVVDDSQTARELLVALYDAAGFEVVGVGKNGEDALQLVKKHSPDVVSMDVVMPKMDGLKATRAIMHEHPTPIVVVTASLMRNDIDMTFDALNAGALAAMRKPGLEDMDTCEKLVETVRLMAGVSVVRRWSSDQISTDNRRLPAAPIHGISNGIRLIGIASSTGGPGVLAQILKPLPENFPIPIVIVQHVTNGFSVGLADWLDGQVDLQVRVSGHGDYPKAGVVLMPPDDYHVQLSKNGTVELSKAPPFKGLRPSANYLFHSMAHFYGSSGMGIILTGMGDDGAEGMEAMYRAGAPTIAQDEESCVVYGMPHEAVKRKAVRWVMTPDQISQKLLEFT